MSGDIEVGKCDICGNVRPLQRKYYRYPIQCECHSPHHFELVCHCKYCEPKEPEFAKLTVSTKVLNNILK